MALNPEVTSQITPSHTVTALAWCFTILRDRRPSAVPHGQRPRASQPHTVTVPAAPHSPARSLLSASQSRAVIVPAPHSPVRSLSQHFTVHSPARSSSQSLTVPHGHRPSASRSRTAIVPAPVVVCPYGPRPTGPGGLARGHHDRADLGTSCVLLAGVNGSQQSVAGLHQDRAAEQDVPHCLGVSASSRQTRQSAALQLGRSTERSAGKESARPCTSTGSSKIRVRSWWTSTAADRSPAGIGAAGDARPHQGTVSSGRPSLSSGQ